LLSATQRIANPGFGRILSAIFLLAVCSVWNIPDPEAPGTAAFQPCRNKNHPASISVLSLQGFWFSEVSAHTATELHRFLALYWKFWEHWTFWGSQSLGTTL